MSTPKIVLIDYDIKYAFLLQAKLGEYFLNDIDLELITEPSYYKRYFAEPRTIDLLIIDEDLFNSELKKHNVRKVMLLTEKENPEAAKAGNVFPIYKFSDIRDFFNVINSRSIGIISASQTQMGTKVVLVSSASGGVGKTTLALGLSVALEKDYKKVLYVDAESFQTFYHLMSNPEFLDGNDMLDINGDAELCKYLEKHITNKELSYLPAFRLPILSVGVNFDIYVSFIKYIKKSEEYDYIIVDSDSSLDQKKVDLMGCADKVIFVLDQSDKSCFAMSQLLKHISAAGGDNYLFVCNRFDQKTDIDWNLEEQNLGFSISEFVENYTEGRIDLHDLSTLSGIQRLAFLLQ